MTGWPAGVLALIGLLIALGGAVARPKGWDELTFAAPGALLVLLTGALPWSDAGHTITDLAPTVGFLAAILVLAHCGASEGLFAYLAARAAALSGPDGRRLLAAVVLLATGVTIVLTLDSTVVLLTPVVLAAAHRLGLSAKPVAHASVRLANSGSLLLPVSNLTNLLAFAAAGVSFGAFAAVMALPAVVVVLGEWILLRLAYRSELSSTELPSTEQPVSTSTDIGQPPLPRFAAAVVAATLTAIVVGASFGIEPVWATLAGAAILSMRTITRREQSARSLLGAANLGFCGFVFCLAIVVAALMRHGLADLLGHVLPSGTSFGAILAVTFVAAVLANTVNNLPATLALAPLLMGSPVLVLAMLIGVNVGPNATYPGSLATLLWRRIAPPADRPSAARFHLIGLLGTPLLLVVGAAALWASAFVVL